MTLFIGGELDGQRIDIPEDYPTFTHVPMQVTEACIGEGNNSSHLYKTVLYKRETFRGVYKHSVMILASHPELCPMKMILDGYRKPQPPEVKQ